MNGPGESRMGIGFPGSVDVRGFHLLGWGDGELHPASAVVVGYRNGQEVSRTRPFRSLGSERVWFDVQLLGVDRIAVLVQPKMGAIAQYGLDNLTFRSNGSEIVLDFESRSIPATLTGSDYGGLKWERGSGGTPVNFVHPPVPDEPLSGPAPPKEGLGQQLAILGGTSPSLTSSFIGPAYKDATGAIYIVPDTCGAAGINHFVTVVNSNISVYIKSTGQRVLDADLDAFLAGDSRGDPRVLFDQTLQRFIVIAVDFDDEVSLAVSNTSNPTGLWTKATFNPSQGSDAGAWPDYPTLGVNKDFIVICAKMVGAGLNSKTVFAVDKQAFASSGTLTVTAFRGILGSTIQGAATWDDESPQYLVSRVLGSGIRLHRLNPPASSPSLSQLGVATTPVGSSPPDAAALGSTTPLDTVGPRLMNALWIDGFLWTTNCIDVDGRAGCRWYQVDTGAVEVVQAGTVSDPVLHFFMPSIAVNAAGDAVMGFSGSSENQYAGAYFTGRRWSDPPGQMGLPVMYKAGEGPYERLDSSNRNRWGDYSLTGVDPSDGLTFWTIQEYARPNNEWGTYVASLGWPAAYAGTVFVDCDYTGIETGTFTLPFDTVTEGIQNAPINGTIILKSTTCSEAPMTISTPLSFLTFGGWSSVR